MSKRPVRTSSRNKTGALLELSGKENRLDPVLEEEEVTQVATGLVAGPSAPPPVIPTVVMATYKAIYIPSNVIPPTELTNPVPDTVNKVDLKVANFTPADSEYEPRFMYDSSLHKSIPVRLGVIEGLEGAYIVPARNIFKTSDSTEALVTESVWAAVTMGRTTEVRTLAYEVTPILCSNVLANYKARLVCSIDDMAPRFERYRASQRPVTGFNAAVAVSVW